MNIVLGIGVYFLIGAIEAARFVLVNKIYRDPETMFNTVSYVTKFWPAHYATMLAFTVVKQFEEKDEEK
jgi:hypothetical protein